MARVLISVTHLLGTGHLSRALTLARAFATAGHEAHLMSGGMPVQNLSNTGVSFHQLPPVKSDGVNFTVLLSETGPANDAYLADRKTAALDILHSVAPDVLITELYPFGRRVLKGEFLALLNAARDLPSPPKVFSSVRDILAPPSKPKKALEAEAVIAGYYDHVLVHSNERLTPLDLSWPVTPILKEKLLYTGFVAPPVADPHPEGIGQGEIIVTAGGGDVGLPLFQAAVDAAGLDNTRVWRLLVGGANAVRHIETLQARATSKNVVIESTRPDFRQILRNARATICMCGYNTAMDVLQSQIPAVFVPFDAGGEVEQTLRAESLSRQAGLAVVKAENATGPFLLEALTRVTNETPDTVDLENFLGAENTVKLVEKYIGSEV